MKIGKKIGEGGNSEVYEWGNENKVIKLAKSNIDKTDLEREFNNTLAAWKGGVSVPRPYEMVEYDQRPGIVFDRIYGETLKDHLFKSMLDYSQEDQPTIDWNDVRNTARLLSEIHQLTNDDMPSQRDSLKRQIRSVDYLNELEKNAVIDILNDLPVKKKLCHGDPNPNNMILNDGAPMLIDWNDATSGNPEADIAEYIIMIRFAVLPPGTPQPIISVFDSIRDTIIQVFMDEYTLRTRTTYDDVDPWIVPIAARKLSAAAVSYEEKQLLVKEIQSRLKGDSPLLR